MSNKMKCPFCGEELDTENYYVHCHNPHCNTTVEMEGTEEMWEALIQSQQQLKLLEPIVASLQGRADINAEVARDSNELVVQWYEKYEQTQRDLQTAVQALEEARINLDAIQPYLGDEYILSCKQDGLKAIDDTLEQIEHKE